MTVSAWPLDVCPECRQANSVELTADTRLCLGCRHEWAPIDMASVPYERPAETVTPAPRALAAVADHADVSEAPAHVRAARSKYVGAVVALPDLAVEGVITDVSADGWATVELDDTFEIDVTPDEFTIVNAHVIPDETITALATTDMAVAALILRAGAQSLRDHDGVRGLTLPPDGWLPDDSGMMPVIEHGAGYAVGILAIAYGATSADLLTMADNLDTAAEAAKGTDNP